MEENLTLTVPSLGKLENVSLNGGFVVALDTERHLCGTLISGPGRCLIATPKGRKTRLVCLDRSQGEPLVEGEPKQKNPYKNWPFPIFCV